MAKIFIKKLTVTSFIVVAVAGLIIKFHPLMVKAASTDPVLTPVPATAADLQAAGFDGAKKIDPKGGRFEAPRNYFYVTDKVADVEAGNVVMVDSDYYNHVQKFNDGALFTYGADSHLVDVPGVVAREATIADSRIAINFIKGNNYTVIIGPNKDKVEKLAKIMAAKIK